MSQSPQHRNLVMDTYNKIVQNGIDNPLELLQSTIDYLTFEKSNVSEISLLYCLQSDYYFEKDLYDKAYKSAMAAAQVDSDREQVLWALIRIHTQQTNGNEGARSNPHEDDEKALQYCTKLENLYPDNRYSLYVASHCYSALGLYDKAIRILKRVFSKISEKPIIETSQQIKISEPVADRNQTNEVDTDEKEEEECKEHATTNDSENENKTDETLSQRKASPTLDVKAIDIHTKTPHPPSKVSQTMTHRDVSSEKSDSAWGRFVPVCANHEEASLNQVFEFRDEVVTIGRATSNDVTLKCAVVSSKHCKLIRGIKDGHQAIFLEDTSTNGTWIDQTKLLKKRLRIDDGMEIIFVDAHGSKKRTKKVSYVLHLETEHKDGEESTEQSITNSDSEGETKTQETQDDENNKENRQSIKDSNSDSEGETKTQETQDDEDNKS
eukprot:3614_1